VRLHVAFSSFSTQAQGVAILVDTSELGNAHQSLRDCPFELDAWMIKIVRQIEYCTHRSAVRDKKMGAEQCGEMRT
jgi:hypothetical protein